MYTEITIEEALRLRNTLLVDVRAEDEYSIDTIPGAVNIPALRSHERVAVGQTYRQEGEVAALELGYRLVAPQLNQKRAAALSLAEGRSVTVFCWRGGQRSKAMAEFLAQDVDEVYRVIGGYKSYRRHVLDYLERQDLPLESVVFHGLTGTGKTELLIGLAAKGLPVLDLEGLARHRGSVYGKIGLPPSPSQKAFESQIVTTLKEAVAQGWFGVECESRRVGKLLTPPLIMEYIRQGRKVLLYCSMEERVKRIRRVYTFGGDEHIAALQESTAALGRWLGRERVAELNRLLAEKEYDRVIAFMLERHYDPLYKYPDHPDDGYELCVDTTNMDEAVERVYQYMTQSRTAG